MYFHAFFDKLSNKLLWLFCLFGFFFPYEIAFSSFLRNELKRFASGAILPFAKKKSQLASNFKRTRTWTIYEQAHRRKMSTHYLQKMARDRFRAMSLAPWQKCPRNVVQMKEAMAAFFLAVTTLQFLATVRDQKLFWSKF